MFMPTYTMNGFNWHDHRGKDNLGFIRALKGMSMEYLPARVPSFMCLVEQQMTQIMATYKKVGGVTHLLHSQDSMVLIGAQMPYTRQSTLWSGASLRN